MDNNFELLLVGQLDMVLSKKNIDSQIRELSKSLTKLELNIEVDKNLVKSLNQIVESCKNVKDIFDKSNEVIEKTTVIEKELDGTTKKVTESLKRNNEIHKETITTIDKRKQQVVDESKAIENEVQAVGRLISEFKELGDIKNSKLNFNANGQQTSGKLTFGDGEKNTTLNVNKDDKVTSYSITRDYEQQAKDAQKATEETEKFIESKNKLIQKANELYQVGLLENNQIAKFEELIQNSSDTKGLSKANDEYKRLYDIQNELLKVENARYSASKNEEAETQRIQKQNELLQNQLDLYKRQAELNVSKLQNSTFAKGIDKTALNSYLDSVNNLQVSPKMSQEIKQLNMDFKELQANAKAASKDVNSFGDAWTHAISKFTIWLSAGTAVMQVFNYFKEGIQYVADLSNQFTQIQIVTGKTTDQIDRLSQKYRDMANEMKLTNQEVVEGAEAFYKRGMSDSQVDQMLEANKMYSKISGLDPTKSAELLTAATNSMHVGVQKVIDDWAVLDSNSAASADELGIAFQKIGSTAESLGLSFEKVNSWTAELLNTTREAPETIGNSIKSLLARMSSLKENGFAELEDGTTVSMNQVSKALDTVGISMVNANGEMANMGDVIDQLGGKWHTLDEAHQKYIATTISGVYQYNKFLTLMNGYSDSQKLLNDELNSAGVAQQRYNVWLDSTEAHMNQLKNAGTGIWQDTFDSQSIKNTIDMLTSLVNGIDGLVKKFGAFPTVMLAASMAFTMFSSKGKLISKSITDIVVAVAQVNPSLNGLTRTLVATQAASEGAAIGFDVLKTSIRTLLSSFGIGIVIAGVSFLLEKLTGAVLENSQAQDELNQVNEDAAKTWQQSGAQIEELTKKYQDLSNQVKNGQLSPDNKDFLDVQQQIANIMPTYIDHIGKEGEARLKSIDTIKAENEVMKENLRLKNEEKLASFDDDYNKKQDTIDQKNQDKFENQQTLNSLLDEQKNGNQNGFVDEDLQNKINQAKQQIAKDNLDIQNAMNEQKGLLEDQVKIILSQSDAYNKLDDETLRYFDDLEKGIQKADIQNHKLVPDKQKQFDTAMDIDQKLQNPAVQNMASDEKVKFLKSLQAEAEKAGLSMDWLNQITSKHIDLMVQDGQVTINATSVSDQINKILSDGYDKTKNLTSAINDLNEGKALDFTTTQQLIAENPELVNMWTTQNGHMTFTAETLEKVRQARLKDAQAAIDAKNTILQAQAEALVADAGFTMSEIQNLQTLDQARTLAAKHAEELVPKNKAAMDMHASMVGQSIEDSVGSRLEDYVNLKNQIIYAKALLDGGLTDNAPSSSGSSSIAKGKQEVDALTQSLDKLTAAQEQLQSTVEKYPKSSQVARDDMSKEISLLQQKKSLIQGELARPTSYTLGIGDNAVSINSYDAQKKIADLKKQSVDLDNQILKLKQDIANSHIAQFENAIGEIDLQIKKSTNSESEYKDTFGETSTQVISEIQKQISLYQQKQNLIHQEKLAIDASGVSSDENTQKVQQLQSSWLDLQSSIDGAKQKIVEVNQAMADLAKQELDQKTQDADFIVEQIKNEYEKEKQIRLDTIDAQLKAEEDRHTKAIKAIDDETKAFEDATNAKIKEIDRANSAQDYSDQLTKAQQERADMQHQLDADLLDTSLEGKEKTAALRKQIADKDAEISKMQRDHDAEMQKQGLQDQLDDYKKQEDAKKDTEDTNYQNTKDSFDKQKTEAEHYYATLENDERHLSEIRRKFIEGDTAYIQGELAKVQKSYDDTISKAKEINDLLVKMGQDGVWMNQSDINSTDDGLGQAGNLNNGGSKDNPTPSTQDQFNQFVANSIKWNYSDDATKNQLYQQNQAYRAAHPNLDPKYQNLTMSSILSDPNLLAIYNQQKQQAMVKYITDKLLWNKYKGDASKQAPLEQEASRMRSFFGFPDYTLSDILANSSFSTIIKSVFPNGLPQGFDTGGYTGDFEGGKLGILHKKEIILNQADTKNVLDAVELTRKMVYSFPKVDMNNSESQGTLHFNPVYHLTVNNDIDVRDITDRINRDSQNFLRRKGYQIPIR